MGEIQIETPGGFETLVIAGDEPTTEELKLAQQQFYPQEEVSVQEEEVRGPTNSGEVESWGFRWRFGKADNRVGKTRVIEETFGEGSAMEFGPEDYGVNLDNVTEEIKEKYNLPASGTIRANKPGYSHWDLVNAGAEVRGPLIAAMVAAPFTAGLSLPVAAGVIGTAALLGKGVDEVQEDIQGVQDQKWLPGEGGFFKDDSVVKDMLKEGVIMGAGELILRPVFSFLGRLIKGPGPGYEPARVKSLLKEAEQKGIKLEERDAVKIAIEENRAIINKAVGAAGTDGARPTIGDATGKIFLDRSLAIMEAIFPNKAALRQNTEYVQKLVNQFKQGRITETELKEGIDNRMADVANQLKTIMKDPNKATDLANKELQKVISKEVNLVSDVIKKYANANAKFSTGEAEVLLKKLSQVEKLWRSRGGDLFNNASARLDGISFPLESFTGIINKLDSQLFKEAQNPVMGSETMLSLKAILLKNTKIDDVTTQLAGLRMIGRPSAENAAKRKSLTAELKSLGPKKKLTYAELNELRQNLQMLKSTEAVREISSNTGPLLKEFTDEITNILGRAETEGFKTLVSRGGARRAAGETNQTINAEQAGFQMLRDANKYYADGAKVFLKPEIESLKANINAGGTMDMKKVADLLIRPDEPLYLKQFLSALTFADDVGTSAVRNLSKGVLQDLKSLAEIGDTEGFNALLKGSGIDKKLIKPFEKYAIDAVKQGRTDNTAFINITSSKATMLETMIQQNTREPLLKEGFVSNLANQWVQNTLSATSSKNTFNAVGFFDAFSKLGPQIQNTLFKGDTLKALKSLQDDAFLLSDKTALRELNARNINDLTAKELVETLQKDIANAEQIGANAITKAMATGSITNIDDLTKGFIKNPSSFKDFKNAWNSLPDDVAKPTFEQVMNGPQGVKASVLENLMKDTFPDGLNTSTVDLGKFGANLTKQIKNNEKAYIEIFGEGNEALGKTFVQQLEAFGKQSMLGTTKSYNGKAGLAAAGYIMGAGVAFLAGPVAFATSAAFMYTFPRILRSRAVLRFLTNPRTNARIYNTAKELGVDVGDNKWLLSQVSQETIPLEVRNIINTIMRQGALQQQTIAAGNAEDKTRQVVAQVENNINTEGNPQVNVPSETILQESMLVEPTEAPPILSRRGGDVLRQVEEEKLLGVRN